MTEVFIGIDCGGTNIRVACGDLQGQILFQRSVLTFSGDDEGDLEEKIISLVEEAINGMDGDKYAIKGIGMGIPGVVSNGEVLMCPNIGNLKLKELVAYFRQRHGLDLNVMNDIKCAILGEQWLGAGRGIDNFIFVNIGTGLSLAMILDGELYFGEDNASGELGYWVYDVNEKSGFSEGKAPLEDIFSGKGLADRVRDLYGGDEKAPGLENVGAINTRWVFEEYGKGNPRVVPVVDEGIGHLIAAIANISIVLNPRKIVFGGGVSQDIDLFRDRITGYFNKMVPFPPEIEKSSLGREAGIFGAIRFAILMAGKGK